MMEDIYDKYKQNTLTQNDILEAFKNVSKKQLIEHINNIHDKHYRTFMQHLKMTYYDK